MIHRMKHLLVQDIRALDLHVVIVGNEKFLGRGNGLVDQVIVLLEAYGLRSYWAYVVALEPTLRAINKPPPVFRSSGSLGFRQCNSRSPSDSL